MKICSCRHPQTLTLGFFRFYLSGKLTTVNFGPKWDISPLKVAEINISLVCDAISKFGFFLVITYDLRYKKNIFFERSSVWCGGSDE